MPVPQFGTPVPGRGYADRPAAFGVLLKDGQVALVEVTKPGHAPWFDLPGGAIDPGENESQALVREFGEETGLKVSPGAFLGRADQFFINTDGHPFNNRQALFEAILEGEAADLKIEEDHVLVWAPPFEAAKILRHDSHAWAVIALTRRRV